MVVCDAAQAVINALIDSKYQTLTVLPRKESVPASAATPPKI